MATEHQRLLYEVNALRRQFANMFQVGTIKEVKKDMVRLIIGKDRFGKEVLSPWIYTANHRGGARERRFFKEGQNCTIICPGGNMDNAVVLNDSPNKKFMPPDHANNTGKDEEVYQLEDLRVRKKKDTYEIWLEPPKKQQQEQQQQQQEDQGQSFSLDSHDNKAKPPEQLPDNKGGNGTVNMKVRINKKGGITGRVGKNRFAAGDGFAKIKTAKMWAVVTEKECIVSKEWVVKKDPTKDDDE